LLAILKRRGRTPISAARIAAFKIVVWFAIAASTFGIVVNFGTPHFAVVFTALVSFLAGIAAGVFSIVAAARR
jgi:hypothetical protein